MRQPEEFYGPELARIHAESFAQMWDPAVPFLAALARESSGTCFVSDLGCGDGRMLQALTSQGIAGWGCDISAAFVNLARERGLHVDQCDAARVQVPTSSLVVALGEVLAYSDEEGRTALDAVAASAWACLVSGGHLVFDLPGLSCRASQGWREDSGWFVAGKADIQGDPYAEQL